MHLILWLIFRQSHPNFINVRTAYASKIWAQLTKNLLAKSSTKRFREYIKKKEGNIYDSKCNYRVELGRKPNYIPQPQIKVSNVDESPADEKIETPKTIDTNYIYISTSNLIELPNDHVLFKTNENNTIKFRNVKTKQEQNIPLYDIIKNLPVAEGSEIPLVSKEILEGLYSAIYKNEDTSFFENINNPSSGNPSSSSMPHS